MDARGQKKISIARLGTSVGQPVWTKENTKKCSNENAGRWVNSEAARGSTRTATFCCKKWGVNQGFICCTVDINRGQGGRGSGGSLFCAQRVRLKPRSIRECAS